jgi:hypothetical protein
MMATKEKQRRRTYSGDHYVATEELWEAYWIAVKNDNWDYVMHLETGQDPDFTVFREK